MFLADMAPDHAEGERQHRDIVRKADHGKKIGDNIDRHDEIAECGQQDTADASRRLRIERALVGGDNVTGKRDMTRCLP